MWGSALGVGVCGWGGVAVCMRVLGVCERVWLCVGGVDVGGCVCGVSFICHTVSLINTKTAGSVFVALHWQIWFIFRGWFYLCHSDWYKLSWAESPQNLNYSAHQSVVLMSSHQTLTKLKPHRALLNMDKICQGKATQTPAAVLKLKKEHSTADKVPTHKHPTTPLHPYTPPHLIRRSGNDFSCWGLKVTGRVILRWTLKGERFFFLCHCFLLSYTLLL